MRKLLIESVLGGHTVIEATDGRDAQAKLQAGQKVDLVITDFSMPLMNGIELAEWMKKIHPGIPIILTSTVDREDYSPADVFLLKPDGFADFPDILVRLFSETPEKLD